MSEQTEFRRLIDLAIQAENIRPPNERENETLICFLNETLRKFDNLPPFDPENPATFDPAFEPTAPPKEPMIFTGDKARDKFYQNYFTLVNFISGMHVRIEGFEISADALLKKWPEDVSPDEFRSIKWHVENLHKVMSAWSPPGDPPYGHGSVIVTGPYPGDPARSVDSFEFHQTKTP